MTAEELLSTLMTLPKGTNLAVNRIGNPRSRGSGQAFKLAKLRTVVDTGTSSPGVVSGNLNVPKAKTQIYILFCGKGRAPSVRLSG